MMRIFFAGLAVIGLFSVGMMVFLTDPLRLAAPEMALFFSGFFVVAAGVSVSLLFVFERHLHMTRPAIIRRGILLGAAGTFLLYAQGTGMLTSIFAVFIAGAVLAVDWLFERRRKK